jgi:hypothetical protein
MRILRVWRHRFAQFLVAALLLSGGAVIASAGSASAAGCTLGICGKVDNQSGFGMYTTVGLNASNAPNLCAVWNKNGGATWDQVTWKCWQRYLGPHSSRGGNFTGVDVDAFTFNDRPYYVVIDGQSLLVQQGLWTKISNTQTATCKDYVASAARCVVWYTG